jgi:hypothetical protein
VKYTWFRCIFGTFLAALVLVLPAWAACPSGLPSGVTVCYYVDYTNSGGAASDSNAGTSESLPWLHAPTMANATGVPAAHTAGAGEAWIFKGGVTVDYHAYPMNVPWGGSSGTPDYMGGGDLTWYTGGSFTRPIFNGGGSTGYDTSARSLVTDISHHASYLIFDNVEFTGIYFGAACSNSGPYTCGALSQYAYNGSDVSWEVKNVYVHGWSHCSFSGACSDPGNEASFIYAKQDAAASSIHDTVINGADGSKDCCNAAAAWNEYNLYIGWVDNAVFGEIEFFHDSTITNMVPPSNGVHGNCIHLFGSTNPLTELIYNDFISCLNTGTADEMFLVEEDYAAVYGFNLVLVQDGHGTMFELGQNNGGGGNYTFFNNTAECGVDATPGSSCFTGKNGAPTVVGAGNFFITDNASQPTVLKETNSSWSTSFPSPLLSVSCSGGVSNPQTNFGGNQICAPTGTLNISESYPFAPLNSGDASTVGRSQSNSSYCTTIAAINAAAGSACLSDTTLGVVLNANNTVSQARSPVTHPVSGTWQNGAYEFTQTVVAPSISRSGVMLQ